MAAAAHPFGAGGFEPWTASGALTVVPDTLGGALLATARNRSVRMIPYEKDMLYVCSGLQENWVNKNERTLRYQYRNVIIVLNDRALIE